MKFLVFLVVFQAVVLTLNRVDFVGQMVIRIFGVQKEFSVSERRKSQKHENRQNYGFEWKLGIQDFSNSLGTKLDQTFSLIFSFEIFNLSSLNLTHSF